MIGFILVGHGGFASGMASAATAILGAQEKFLAVDFAMNETGESLHGRIQAAMAELQCEKTLLFTDVLGGTPFNCAALLAQANDNVEVVTGTNLPMLLEALLHRNVQQLPELARKIAGNGQESIRVLRDLLAKE